MILLRRYRLTQSGSRGFTITVPKEYVEDVSLKSGQKMAIYRDGNNLVIIPEDKARKEPAYE